MSLISTPIYCLSSFLSPRLEPAPDSISSPILASILQDVAYFTRIRDLQHAAALALNIHESVQAIDHGDDSYLQLAANCCKAVNCALSIPSIRSHATNSLPPSLAGNVDTLLRILQDIRGFVHGAQLRRLWVGRRITHRMDAIRIEQYQHDLNHLSWTFDGQLLCASGVEQRAAPPDGLAPFRTTFYHPPMVPIPSLPAANTTPTVGSTNQVPPQLLSCHLSFASMLSLLADMARNIYMLLLLFMPLLYSSRAPEIRVPSDTNLDYRMRVLAPQLESNPGSQESTRLEIAWDSFSQKLIEEWHVLRTVSSLALGLIFAMYQITSIRQNQTITAAALFLFVSVIYGSVLMIYVNGWRGISSSWVQEIREPFTIGFLWNTWILLALPAIWATWGLIFFLLSMITVWISHQGDDDSDVRNLIPSTLAESTLSPRFTITHPWFIPLFAIAMVYLVLMVYTLWRLSGHHRTTDRPTDMA